MSELVFNLSGQLNCEGRNSGGLVRRLTGLAEGDISLGEHSVLLAHRPHTVARVRQGGPTEFLPLTLFAARLVLLEGRANALRLIRFRFLGLLGWFVF